MTAVRKALLDVARELKLPTGRYPATAASRAKRTPVQPCPLDLAVLAIEMSEALELVAAEHVNRARELDGVTWADVGEAFDTTMQSAHSRFRPR